MINLLLLAYFIAVSCIIGHIVGAMVGQLLAKIVTCFVGIEVRLTNGKTGASEIIKFKGYEAWEVQNDFERIRRHHRDTQAAGR